MQTETTAVHDYSRNGTMAVECPRCRIPHGAFLTVIKDGVELECREYSGSEMQHIIDHVPPETCGGLGCRCGMTAHPRVADLSLNQ